MGTGFLSLRKRNSFVPFVSESFRFLCLKNPSRVDGVSGKVSQSNKALDG